MNENVAENEYLDGLVELDWTQEMDITALVANSPVLLRLVEEVRSQQSPDVLAYNRMHNRHNRSR